MMKTSRNVYLSALLTISICSNCLGLQEDKKEAGEPKQAASETDNVKALSINHWLRKLQATGRILNDKATTDAAKSIARKELVEEISKSFDGTKVEFRTRVTSVKWKDGIAKVSTQVEFQSKTSKRSPLIVERSQPIELELTEDEAAKIAPGARLKFEAKLKFHPRRWGLVGQATSSQQMYGLRHKLFGNTGHVGTFTTTEFTCSINGKEMTPRWVAKAAESDEQADDN